MQFPYTLSLMYTLSSMAKKEGWLEASNFFHFQELQDGITIHGIRKWPGIGFAFHGWLRLDELHHKSDTSLKKSLQRYQLYSFLNSYGAGFEAFFTEDQYLVVATSTKKDYHAACVIDQPLSDGAWHCIDICHSPARRPFTQSCVTVYIDGRQKLVAQLKFPSLSEPFTYCRLGTGGQRTSLLGHHANNNGESVTDSSPMSIGGAALNHLTSFIDKERLMSVASNVTLPRSIQNVFRVEHDPAVQVCSIGLQDSNWGLPHSLHGQIGSLCVFHDVLLLSQIKCLYLQGPNSTDVFNVEKYPEIGDLANSLIFRFDAKAYSAGRCVDLSPYRLFDGQVTGTHGSTTAVKDLLQPMGGFPALYPLLENAGKMLRSQQPDFCGLSPQNEGKDTEDLSEEWVVLSSRTYAVEWRVHQNQVASFLLLVLHMIQGHPQNQDELLEKSGIPIIGALMQKIPSSLVDVNLLMATQLLVEGAASCEKSAELLQSIYRYILFDFAIWSKGTFPVRIGHIQYLSTIIKDDWKYFRKHYGTQYFLDTIQAFYSNCTLLTTEDVKTIRMSLLGLVKFYLSRSINFQEVSALFGFLITVKEEEMVVEVLETLQTLVESPHAKDQLFLLLYEPSCGELLYGILLNQDFSSVLKTKVLKLISSLLKSDKVYEKSKSRLRLHDIGISSLTTLLTPQQFSPEMVSYLLDQILMTETAESFQGALFFLSFIRNMEVVVKFNAVKKFLCTIQEKSSCLNTVANQIGWQECLLGLLIKQPITGVTDPLSSCDLIDFSSDVEQKESQQDIGISETEKTTRTESPSVKRRLSLRRLSQHSSSSLRSLEESLSSLPKTPQFLLQLKDHIFDFEIPYLLDRPRSNSQISSSDDVSTLVADESLNDDIQESSSTSVDIHDEASIMEQNTVVDDEQVESDIPTNVCDVLCTAVCETVFLVMWRGVQGSGKEAWIERGEVFACINMLALSNHLYQSHLNIKRHILELTLESCLVDLQEAGQASATYTENAMELMKIVYDFVVLENIKDDRRLSVKLLEDVLSLLDVLLVFEDYAGEEGWLEMAEIGLGIILVCASCENLELCAIATAKLHALVQTRPHASLNETCYLLTTVDRVLTHSVEVGDQEHYSFLIPVVRALLDKVTGSLQGSQYLQSLPDTVAGPAFFEDFQHYILSQEWRSFINKMVQPHQGRYCSFSMDEIKETMNMFWNQCYEKTKVDLHKRNREVGESKLRFQTQVMEVFHQKAAEENNRYSLFLTSLRNQNLLIRRRWRLIKLYLTGPCGPWASRLKQEQHWKLSQCENFARMRLKLTFNFNFDIHKKATRLRDNQGTNQQSSLSSLPPVAQEARVSHQEEDSLQEEELQNINASEIEGPDASGKVVISEDCELVTLMSRVKGRFEVTSSHVYFLDMSPIREEGERYDFKYSLVQLREVHLRRYNLRRSALEFFLIDQSNFFLNFTQKTRNKIYSRLISLKPVNLFYSHGIRSPAELLKASGLTTKWIQREISNFEYLMQLNTIAGRTYNDLSQYPVFPWILADYTSEELDLENPAVFRDLSRPIGVVNPKNVSEVKTKYDHFVDITGMVEKFHYGTHYSNSAGVVHYMVRMEPFTSLHIELQSGRFDVADRQFQSIEATWRMLMENPNDVKELIPEFYFLPEFLVNLNGFDLGRLQGTKENVNDVKLPVWAKSPEDFIYKHRKALESEYVSSHLHEWIDLIFGYKQKGPAAVEALNVFYYVSYEGAVDLEAIKDPVERAATEGMINNFGQTPCQLLKEPHPERMSFEEAMLRMSKAEARPPSLFLFLQNLKVFFIEASTSSSPLVFVTIPRSPARSFIQHGMLEALVTVGQNGVVGVHGWLPYDRSRLIPNYFTFEKDPTLSNNKTTRRVSGPFQPGLEITSKLFIVTHDAKYIISGGHWDNSLRLFSLSKNKVVSHIVRHIDVITCLALDHCGIRLITGSRDTTSMVWEINTLGNSGNLITAKPLKVLCGHESEVTCVAVATELDMAVTGSKDGRVNIHSLIDGLFFHTLVPSETNISQEVTYLSVSDMGYICVFYKSTETEKLRHHLNVFSLNGNHLCETEVGTVIRDITVCGDYIVTGSEDGTLTVYETFGLKLITTLSLHLPILAVTVTPSKSHILASLQDGKLIVVGVATATNQR
ncbi:neurobeachin-like protein 1 [Tachypleus tridentatus]|uniref:neurobeachin-like protein 1 n=1 Tax=Tachypleus tridentatus TaxID=6853 RepID=UPI003FD1125D